jgi:hypothetical protein
MSLDVTRSGAYLVFALLTGLWLCAFFGAAFFRPRLRGARRLPRYGTAGQTLAYRWLVQNAGLSASEGVSVSERFHERAPSYREFRASRGRLDESRTAVERWSGYGRWRALTRRWKAAAPSCPLPATLPGGRGEAAATAVPARRGRLEFQGATLERVEPLGLLKAFSPIEPSDQVLVLPKRYPVGRLSLPGASRHQPGGVALASRIGDSPEFVGLRDYRPGDPLRRIDWKAWAKEGRPIVREYHDEQFVRHALVLDTFAPPEREVHFEEAVSVAASFAATVLTQESLLDLLFVVDQAYCVTAGRGVGSAEHMLEVLAGVERCDEHPFSLLAASVGRRTASLTGCLFVLTDYDAQRRALVESVEASGVPVRAYVVCGPERTRGADWPPSIRRLEIGKIAEGLAAP